MRNFSFFSRIALVLVFSVALLGQQATKPAPSGAGKASAVPAAASASKSSVPASYKDLKFAPLNKIQVPEPVRFQLSNGMVVYLVEDHEIPMISVSAMVRVGSRWEPEGKTPLASITGSVMRTGGTPTRNGDKLDEELDRLGASVETGIGEDSGRAFVSVLKEDIDKGLAILSDILQNPAFPQDKIDLAKIQVREGIARRNDDPAGIPSREFARLMYGPNSAYAHQAEYETMDSITREDLIEYHRQFFQPENLILGAWGDFNAEEMRAKIEKAVDSWKRGGKPQPPVPAVDEAYARQKAGLYFISREEVNQSWIVMGHLGGKRNDPDFYALDIANYILGGSMSSRLFSNVRTKEGLAYSVGSGWGAGWDRIGTFRATGNTKGETTVKVVNAVKEQINTIASGGITLEELSKAKDSILKGFAFEFDSTGKIIQRLMSFEYYGYPKDYLQKYRENIEKVTREDAARVAKQYFKPDQFIVVVLGNEKRFEQPLSSISSFQTLDITIPQPKSKQDPLSAATPESVALGKQILSSTKQAMGGAAIDKIADQKTSANLLVQTPQGAMDLKMETTFKLPNKVLSVITLPMGQMTSGFDGNSVWMKSPQGTQVLPDSQKGDRLADLNRNTLMILRNFNSEIFKVQALEKAEVEGKPVNVVALIDNSSQKTTTLYIDLQSGLLLKKAYNGTLMGGPPADIEEFFADYREVDGIKMAFKTTIMSGGQKRAEISLSEVKFNTGADDSLFVKP
jgi:predicted Zn-dependent peptidase/outer membrane lipoprotein-sorting protein